MYEIAPGAVFVPFLAGEIEEIVGWGTMAQLHGQTPNASLVAKLLKAKEETGKSLPRPRST